MMWSDFGLKSPFPKKFLKDSCWVEDFLLIDLEVGAFLFIKMLWFDLGLNDWKMSSMLFVYFSTKIFSVFMVFCEFCTETLMNYLTSSVMSLTLSSKLTTLPYVYFCALFFCYNFFSDVFYSIFSELCLIYELLGIEFILREFLILKFPDVETYLLLFLSLIVFFLKLYG